MVKLTELNLITLNLIGIQTKLQHYLLETKFKLGGEWMKHKGTNLLMSSNRHKVKEVESSEALTRCACWAGSILGEVLHTNWQHPIRVKGLSGNSTMS